MFIYTPYSTNSLFSDFVRGIFGGHFGGCARLFGNYLGVILEVFVKDFEGTTIQRAKENTAKTVLFTI